MSLIKVMSLPCCICGVFLNYYYCFFLLSLSQKKSGTRREMGVLLYVLDIFHWFLTKGLKALHTDSL